MPRPVAPPPVSAETFDPSTGFSVAANPNGIYSYGFETALGGPFTPFDTAYGAGNIGYFASPSLDYYLRVGHGSTGPILQHPGPLNQDSVLRLTLPSAGDFTISGSFANADQATTDVHILIDGVSAFDSTIAYPSGNLVDDFSITRNLVVGDTIDFIVGNGGNGYSFDSTFVQASISSVPEPGAWVLMILGFCAVGTSLRFGRSRGRSNRLKPLITEDVAQPASLYG